MWRRATVPAALVIVLATPLRGQQAAPNFAGKWMLDREASVIGGRGNPANELTITQDAAKLTFTRTSNTGTQSTVYRLDGSESKNPAGRSGEAVYRSVWEGSKLVTNITATGRGGQPTQQTETFSLVDGVFRIDTSRPDPQGGAPYVARLIYRKG
jgi:hypothetical protein